MTTREWKVGDRVICNDPGYTDLVYRQEGVIARKHSEDLWGVEVSGCELAHYGHEMILVEGAHESELDAIEREFTDLFTRMRAAIERLK